MYFPHEEEDCEEDFFDGSEFENDDENPLEEVDIVQEDAEDDIWDDNTDAENSEQLGDLES